MATAMLVSSGPCASIGAVTCETRRPGSLQRPRAVVSRPGFECRQRQWSSCGVRGGDISSLTDFVARMPIRSLSPRLPVVVATERSYIMIKPDGVQRGLVGEIISRFERKGFSLKALKLFKTSRDLAEEHYKDLKDKPFFPSLVNYIVSGPVVCMVWEGPGVVASARKLIGATNPLLAEPGTIRGDYGIQSGRNIIHGSDSPDNGEREIALWFNESETVEWTRTIKPWIVE